MPPSDRASLPAVDAKSLTIPPVAACRAAMPDSPSSGRHVPKKVAGTRHSSGRAGKGKSDHYLTKAECRRVSQAADEAIDKMNGKQGGPGGRRRGFQDLCFRRFREDAD